jgi:type II secretory ATPase GspE/PulE/Tfp pilus assembly ATPase PilB-like protein
MEVLILDDIIDRLLMDNAPIEKIESAAREKGWQPMIELSRKLVESGITDKKEIDRILGYNHKE